MKKRIKVFTVCLILTMSMLGFTITASAAETKVFHMSLSEGYNPSFKVTNVTDSYQESEYSDEVHITANAPAKILFDYHFYNVSIKKDGVLYTDNGKPAISLVAKELNKIITPERSGFPAHYSNGYTLEFSQPGKYHIYTDMSDYRTNIFLTVTNSQEIIAKPSTDKVLVNGAPISFSAYNIDGNNYFKLRDIAMAVNGTEKQFEVEWDNVEKTIYLSSHHPYTVVGGELEIGPLVAQKATLNKSEILKHGSPVYLKAYTINDNNYFKLRDVAQLFNIGITWDNISKTIGIDTSKGYIE